jgi:Recombination endonuclease VII
MHRTYVMHKYSMSIADLEGILRRRDERCAICRKLWTQCVSAKRVRHEARFLQYLYVDHDHSPGKIRGLLCNGCNTAIGMFDEDPTHFEGAAAYLARYSR